MKVTLLIVSGSKITSPPQPLSAQCGDLGQSPEDVLRSMSEIDGARTRKSSSLRQPVGDEAQRRAAESSALNL